MPLILADRVRDTTTTTGTGTVTLSGTAPTGYQNFSVIGNANTTYYTINAGSQWEVGIGTYSSTGPTLARTTVLESSNANALVNFSAGTKDVFVTYPSDRAVTTDGTETLTNKTINGSNNTITNVSLTSAVTGTLPVANGGTGVTASSGANSVVLRNANQNFTVNNIDFGFTSIATAAGTTTLTVASTNTIFFTGSTTQTVVMPVTSTLVLGSAYFIRNNSTGNITVNSSGGNLIGTILPGTTFHLTCIDTTVTTAAGWDFGFTDFATATGSGNVVLSASPTFTGTVGASGISASGTITTSSNLATTSSATVALTSSGTIAIGGTSSANAITVGQSTGSQTLNLATGATSSGNTKTLNIGTAGLSGSTTNITIGSAVSGATSTTTLNGTVSIASVIAAPLGAVGTPSYTFTGDTNTGMWSPGADTIAFSEGGVEAMRINSSGNVGIGTTAPAQRLHVRQDQDGTTAALIQNRNGTGSPASALQFISGAFDLSDNRYSMISSAGGSNNTLQFWTAEGAAPTQKMVITSGGNVGIGETSPGARLHVSGGTVGTTAGNLLNVTIDQGIAGSNAVGVRTNLVRVSSGTDWTTTAMRLQGRVDATNFGYIDFVSGGAQGLAFGSDASERMRIDSSGNVGIGTTAPLGRLQVVGSAYFGAGPSDATNATVAAYSDGTGISIEAFQGNSSVTKRNMWLAAYGGNVGIGTNAPGVRLDVAGGDIRIGNNRAMSFINTAGTATARYTLQNDDNFVVYNAAGTPIQSFSQSANAFAVYGGNANNRMIVDSGSNITYWNVNGSERMRIDSSGNVMVGTTSATGLFSVNGVSYGAMIATDRFGILGNNLYYGTSNFRYISNGHAYGWSQGNTDGADLRLLYAGNNTSGGGAVASVTERLYITAAGNVGVGTSSPSVKLDVNGSASFGATITTGTGVSTGDAHLELGGNRTGSGPAYIDFHAAASTDFEARVIRYGGANSSLEINNTGTGGMLLNNSGAAAMVFQTTATERMRIASGGSVGIGTTAPTTIFHVEQNNASNIGMRTRQLSTTQFAGAGLLCNGPVSSSTQGGTAFYHYNRNTGGTNGALAMAQFDENGSFQRSLAEYYYNEQAWIFYTNGSERLRIDSSGRVGIGTSSPDATAILDVSSTTAGFLPPRMSTAQRDAIGGGAPQEGLILYNVTTDKLQVFSAGAWVNLH
jgi:hypothetical protein